MDVSEGNQIMLRLIRAVVVALKMTLRGETPPVSPYQPLLDWIEAGASLAQKAINKTRSQPEVWQMTLEIERRQPSIATILQTIHYHMETEYPYLMQHFTSQSLTAIYATNINDQFAIGKLLQGTPTKSSKLIQQLAEHLDNIPPSQSMSQAT